MAAPSATMQADERKPAQVRQLEDILRHALAKKIEQANPNRAATQQAIDRGNELVEVVNEKLNELFEIEDFSEEEAGFDAQYDYPADYKARPTLVENFDAIEVELLKLKAAFPQLANEDIDRQFFERVKNGEIRMPEGAERWSLIPRWQALAPIYGEAVQIIFDAIAGTRAAHNYRAGALGPDRIRRVARTEEMIERLAAMQGNAKILLVPDQFGKRHAGRSVRRARFVIAETDNEFGYGGFEAGVKLYLHLERLVHYDNLWIDGSGDEYDYNAGGEWSGAPAWYFHGGRLEFDAYWAGDADSGYGAASGFLPAVG